MPPLKSRIPSAKKACEEGGLADPSGSGHADQNVCRRVTQALSRAFAAILPASKDENLCGSNAGQSVNRCSTPSLPHGTSAAQVGPSSSALASQSDSARGRNAHKETSSSRRTTSFQPSKGSTIQQSTTAALNALSKGKRSATRMKHGAQSSGELGDSPSKKCQTEKERYTHNVSRREAATSTKHHEKLAAKIDHSSSKKCKAIRKISSSAAEDYSSKLRAANSQLQLQLQTEQLRQMDGTLLTAKCQVNERNVGNVLEMKIPASTSQDYASHLITSYTQHKLQLQQQLWKREQQTHPTVDVHGPAFSLFNNPSPEPMGERCELCRIDLAFRPPGSLDSYNRDLPVVAVLPCGHAFHDSCLEGIPNTANSSQTPICVCCLE